MVNSFSIWNGRVNFKKKYTETIYLGYDKFYDKVR